jgi:hypothetical protein
VKNDASMGAQLMIRGLLPSDHSSVCCQPAFDRASLLSEGVSPSDYCSLCAQLAFDCDLLPDFT